MRTSGRLALAMVAYVALGMPGAAFAVAWPSAARELGRPLGDLGIVLLTGAVAGLLTAPLTGRVIERVGVGSTLWVGAWVEATAVVILATTRSWGFLLVAVAVLGAAGGVLDAGLNTFAALELSTSAMNMLHAGFGVGATVGPWLLAGVLAQNQGWRSGMVLVAIFVATVALFLTLARRWFVLGAGGHVLGAVTSQPWSRRHLFVLAFFFLAAGVEIATGQWAFTLLEVGRGLTPGWAGVAAGGFFGGLTASRVLLGLAGGRMSTRRVLIGGQALAVVAAALLWWSPVSWIGAIALVLAGIGVGPLFPLHTSLTPIRFGRLSSPRLIAYQIGAAGAGIAVIPWMVGGIVNARGADTIGVGLLAGAMAMAVVGAVVDRDDRSASTGGR